MIDLKHDVNISETLYRHAQNSPHTPNFDDNSEIYLHGYETITTARTGLKHFFDSHNVHTAAFDAWRYHVRSGEFRFPVAG